MNRTALIITFLPFFALSMVSVMFCGCGYHWRSHVNPWKKQNIQTVYVPMITNNTLHPGIESFFTSALEKEFIRGQKLKLVSDGKAADVTLKGTLVEVLTTPNGQSTVPQITEDPEARAQLADMVIASDYSTLVRMRVEMIDYRQEKEGKVLWSRSFQGSKVFPANNRYGLEGTTSALINASQESLTLQNLAQTVASDVYDSLFHAF